MGPCHFLFHEILRAPVGGEVAGLAPFGAKQTDFQKGQRLSSGSHDQ